VQYSQLSEQIQAFTENTFPGTGTWDNRVVTSKQQIDQFIKNAEQRIYNTVQFPSLRKNVMGTVSNGNKYLSTPNDFLSVYSIAIVDQAGRYEFLLNKDVNFIRQAYPSPASTGIPKYYALFGPTTTSDVPPIITNELSIILGPTPNATYSAELHYYYYPESIVDSQDGRTWLGDNFDTVLLYGALVEAAIFMKAEVETLTVYQAKYADALGQAKRLGDGLERGDSYRDGQYKQPVT
jgi:hypothetical protein